MNVRCVILGLISSVIVLFVWRATATPLHLSVRPHGTNQVELTFGPVSPDTAYLVLARTNGPSGHWLNFLSVYGDSNRTMSVTGNLALIKGLSLQTLNHWRFAVGSGEDTDGNGIPDVCEDLVFLMDPRAGADPYADVMGDGWNNLEKYLEGKDPYRPGVPPPPRVNVLFRRYPDASNQNGYRQLTDRGDVILSWDAAGPTPDCFEIQKAIRTMRPPPRWPADRSPNSPNRHPGSLTNRPPAFRPFPPSYRQQDLWETGAVQVIATIPGLVGTSHYTYVDTNVDVLFGSPTYQVRARYDSSPLHAFFDAVDATAIERTLISATKIETTNGYELTINRPIPYARYLLLVRDRNNPLWRASGYFVSGTNRSPIHLRVDGKGMMFSGQKPVALPQVAFLPAVRDPEFIAGWGEDSDGDGLPDAYEVLVTHTQPDNADTGETGILDGYKESTMDGWSNLEKFRRRADPFAPVIPPTPIELTEPRLADLWRAFSRIKQNNFPYELKVEMRNFRAGEAYHPATESREILNPYLQRNAALTNFQVRISAHVPVISRRSHDIW